MDGLLSDYCDSAAYQTHPLFSKYSKALQLILYFDKVENCNALGSKVNKHKLGKLSINCLNFCLHTVVVNKCVLHLKQLC